MSSSPKKRNVESKIPNGSTGNGSVMATFSKAFVAEAAWDDKDEFLDVIYWMRQIIGMVLGLIWGLFPLKGIIALVIFFAINCGVIYIYYGIFQKVDDEEYGGPTEILKEGLMTSFSTFVVTWIILYSSLYSDL
ncbi:uncharacterized protein C20orf24 homolog [Mizuhopecten yessoensis]|uniref:uncharacterized protein C20orf24 homolog n=1 Tax=Mizuhopecten yessoensis TaxID=6573 RepID=UPI000B45AF1C|nr:uncharacterized protein C20orf24 homolog [Mizuhopecten yessoensis]